MRSKQIKKEKWNPWFAWYPVTVGNERVWLETVERKKYWCEEIAPAVDPYDPGGRDIMVSYYKYRNLTPR
jgi:hypothetical protein